MMSFEDVSGAVGGEFRSKSMSSSGVEGRVVGGSICEGLGSSRRISIEDWAGFTLSWFRGVGPVWLAWALGVALVLFFFLVLAVDA